MYLEKVKIIYNLERRRDLTKVRASGRRDERNEISVAILQLVFF
jgi:hypothetical protein